MTHELRGVSDYSGRERLTMQYQDESLEAVRECFENKQEEFRRRELSDRLSSFWVELEDKRKPWNKDDYWSCSVD